MTNSDVMCLLQESTNFSRKWQILYVSEMWLPNLLDINLVDCDTEHGD